MKIRNSDKPVKEVIIEWFPELRDCINKIIKLHGNVVSLKHPPYLFHQRNGKRVGYDSVWREFSKTCKAAGIENARQHDFRKKAITDLEMQGGDGQVMGLHSERSQTEDYIEIRRIPSVKSPQLGGNKS